MKNKNKDEEEYLSIDPSICLSVCLFLCLSLSVSLFLCLSVSVCLSLSVCLSIYLSNLSNLSIYPSIHPSIHLSINQSIYLSSLSDLSIYLSINPRKFRMEQIAVTNKMSPRSYLQEMFQRDFGPQTYCWRSSDRNYILPKNCTDYYNKNLSFMEAKV